MDSTAAATLPASPPSRLQLFGRIVLFSLAITTVAGLAAAIGYRPLDVRFLWLFVVLRWIVIAVLLAAPLVAKARPSLRLPLAMRTPLTALLLVCESIIIDIISAQTH